MPPLLSTRSRSMGSLHEFLALVTPENSELMISQLGKFGLFETCEGNLRHQFDGCVHLIQHNFDRPQIFGRHFCLQGSVAKELPLAIPSAHWQPPYPFAVDSYNIGHAFLDAYVRCNVKSVLISGQYLSPNSLEWFIFRECYTDPSSLDTITYVTTGRTGMRTSWWMPTPYRMPWFHRYCVSRTPSLEDL